MSVLLIDGVKYYFVKPEKEEEEFHPIVREHSKEIFGAQRALNRFMPDHKRKLWAKLRLLQFIEWDLKLDLTIDPKKFMRLEDEFVFFLTQIFRISVGLLTNFVNPCKLKLQTMYFLNRAFTTDGLSELRF